MTTPDSHDSASAASDGSAPDGSASDGTVPQGSGTSSTAPSRQDRLRPLEFIVLSAIIAVFIGLVVLLSTRELVLSLIFFGIAFIVSLVVIAMLSLSMKPNAAERVDLTNQDHESDRGH